jgi:reverse transcriptase-like protein
MQSWGNALDGLDRERGAAKRDKRLRFTAQLHQVSVALLTNSFYALKREAAPGVDGFGVQHWRKHWAAGEVIVVRYADDSVLGFQYRADAERFLQEWKGRLQEFGLELHPDKTRLIEFGRFAATNRKERVKGSWGFTHICGQTRKNGKFLVLRKTIRKRLRAKLQQVKEALRRIMHQPLAGVGKWLRSVTGLLQLSSCSWQHSQSSQFSFRGEQALVKGDPPSQPEETDHLGAHGPICSPMAPFAQNPSSVSPLALGKSRRETARAALCGALGNWRPYRDQIREPMNKL